MGQASRWAITAGRMDSAIRFFLYILIFWLPYSPAVVEVCVIISLLLWFAKRAFFQSAASLSTEMSFPQKTIEYLKRFKVTSSCLNGPIAFFLIVCILSVVSSSFFENAAHHFLTKTLEWFIVYFLVIEVFNEKKHIVVALGIWLFTALSTVLDSLIQFYITNKDIFSGYVIEPQSRATAGFKTSNGLGAYLSILIPFLLSMTFISMNKIRYRILAVLILGFSCWSLMVTSSRGAMFGVAVGIVFFALVLYLKKMNVNGIIIFRALLIAAVLAVCIVWIVRGIFGFDLLTKYRNIEWRFNVWMDSIEMIKERPILGHGINTFMELFQVYRRDPLHGPAYAHNCYIQLAVETGIAGLLGFLWILYRLFKQSLKNIEFAVGKNKSLRILSIGLLSGILSFLIHGFFDTHLYSLQLSTYIWLMIGLLVSLNEISLNPIDN